MARSKKHLVIPDIQAKPGQSLTHLTWVNNLIRRENPEVVVQIGDLWDMPSLSSYDKGRKSAENKRLTADWNIGVKAVDILMKGVAKSTRWIYTEGNHENRIARHESDHPALEGYLPNPVAFLKQRGWEAHEFLKPAKVDGITYAHLFPRSANGTVSAHGSKFGAANALNQVKANMCTVIAGHKQGYDSAMFSHAHGIHRGIIAGSCYTHDESYLTPQGIHYWRGVLLLHDVNNGMFDIEEWSLRRLKKEHGK